MDLNLIKPFLAVYQFNSITKAAESLDVTQPAMSASIRRMEESIGKQLFVRHARRIEPTSDAHELAVHFQKMMEHYEAALDFDRDLLVYAAEPIMLRLPIVQGIQMIESPATDSQILEELRQGTIDMVFDNVSTSDPSFQCEQILKDRLVLALDRSNPIESVTMEEYLNLDHVALTLKRDNAMALEAYSGLQLKRNIVRTHTSPSNLMLSIRGTQAVCGILESMIPLANELGLKSIELPYQTREVTFNLIYHKRNLRNERHSQVREQILSLLKK